MRRSLKLRIIGLLSTTLILIVLFGYVLKGRHGHVSAETKTPNQAVTLLPVATFILGQIAPPTQLDAYRGLVVPSKKAELGSRRGGRVVSFAVEEGSRVQQGDILMRLDSSDVRSQLLATRSRVSEAQAMLAELVAGPRAQTIKAARSEVTRLEAVLALSQITSSRQRDLMQSNASSSQQVDEARFAVQQSEAALESAKQQLSELIEGTRTEQIAAQQARVEVLRSDVTTLEVDLAETQIIAPFDGIVAKRYVDEGTITSPQAMVLRLIQCNPMEAWFGLSPSDARTFHVGSTVTVTIDEQTSAATVARIEPELDSASRTQAVFVTLSADCGANVVPGQTASLAMARPRELDAMWVPVGALSRAARGLWSVYVVNENGIVDRREVQVAQTDTELARIVGTMVKPGDRLVSGGIHRITPGMTVAIMEHSP